MKTLFRLLLSTACLCLCAQLFAAKKEDAPAAAKKQAAITLADYARANTIKVITIPDRPPLPQLPKSDQTNNLLPGEKVLTLSGKNLCDINGIGKLQVVDGDKTVPISELKAIHLFLNDNALTSLPDELFGMQNVIFLYLEDNRLDRIPADIARMKKLFGMYWTNNKIASIPPEIFGMKQLKKFQISKNQLTEIPEAIGNLTNIVHFNFSSNKISKIPASMSKLAKLRVCDLSDNNISELPEAFGTVKIFHQLRVKNNPLTTLPAGFANMPATIDITGTKIDVSTLSEGLRARISTEKHGSNKDKKLNGPEKARSHLEKYEASQKGGEKTKAKKDE